MNQTKNNELRQSLLIKFDFKPGEGIDLETKADAHDINGGHFLTGCLLGILQVMPMVMKKQTAFDSDLLVDDLARILEDLRPVAREYIEHYNAEQTDTEVH